jgi:redox-sensitive bicupin YhaK (pirin superfamily)
MVRVIRSADRYHVQNEWLSTYWHFSFDHYYDPANVSFGPLRVFNDDTIAPGGGFPFHPHREMEIVTYLIEGELEHQDTLGNRGVISAGEVQRMSAGTGIRHSESNPSKKSRTHLVQLWLLPAVAQLPPSWEQKRYPAAERTGKLLPVAVPAGNGSRGANAVALHQDATIYTSLLRPRGVRHTCFCAWEAGIYLCRGRAPGCKRRVAPCRRSGAGLRRAFASVRHSENWLGLRAR